MTDWTSLEGNREVFDQLVAALAGREAIAFVGAGASIPVGYPSWTQLLEILAEKAVADPVDRAGLLAGPPLMVASKIRSAFGTDGALREAVAAIFGPRTGADGEQFSRAHARLLELPFRGWVTTNYDAGLDAARRKLRPKAPGGLLTWQDASVAKWRTGKVFGDGRCPILWAHGHCDREESIVFDLAGYRRAYLHAEGAAYRKAFDRLWTQEQLVFVGYSFVDPWLEFLAGQVLSDSGQQKLEGPRHVAIMGIPEEHLASLRHCRYAFTDQYHAHVLAYPVRKGTGNGEGHSELTAILDALVAALPPRPAPPPTAPPTLTTSRPSSEEILARYRELVVSDHRKLHGPLELPPGMDVLEHAFVEVQVATRDAERQLDDVAKRPTLDELLELAPGRPDWQQGRWLLAGDPGAGKTTLLRRLAARLAGREDRLPVYQPLPGLVAHDGDPTAFWERRFRDRTSLAGLAGEIEAAGDDGRLVLFLDGYDEVAPGDRQRADDLIEGLSARWPKSRAVVATRPLGRCDLEPPGFVELVLLPLDDVARRSYLEAWLRAAGEADPTATAGDMESELGAEQRLDELSRNPLYLTLLAGLWDPTKSLPRRRSELYERIFDHLYEGRHKPRGERRPFPARETADAVLVDLAYEHTDLETPESRFGALETWLLAPERAERWSRLSRIEAWKGGPSHFFVDVWQKTRILGPRDDAEEPAASDTPWRFAHRTFREALAAKRLAERHRVEGEGKLLAWARDRDEGRWAEPLSLLAGRLDSPDGLLERLTAVNPKLGLRALATAQGVSREGLVGMLKLADNPHERAAVIQSIPEQLGDPATCLALADQLIEARRELNDVYFLHWLLDEIVRRWPSRRAAASARVARLYAALPDPTEPELFRTVVTPRGGRVDLWCRIPKGEGWIGSPDDEEGRYADEGPRYRLTIERPYWLAAVPVTNAQWAQLDARKADLQNPGHPVVDVSWWEAMTFCRWLEHKLGLSGARLPTEEEWEYACRAGTETRYWSGDEENDLERVGWYDGNSGRHLQPVGKKEPNTHGLYDVHGNVWEWTASVQTANYEGRQAGVAADPADEPADLAASPRAERVLRGGSCWDPANRVRSAYRLIGGPGLGFGDQGFRVLLPCPEPAVEGRS